MNAGRALHLLRAICDLTQGEMARVAGLTQPHMSLVVNGRGSLSHAARARLLTALKIPEPVFYLLGATREEVLALGDAAAPLSVELVRYIAARTPKGTT